MMIIKRINHEIHLRTPDSSIVSRIDKLDPETKTEILASLDRQLFEVWWALVEMNWNHLAEALDTLACQAEIALLDLEDQDQTKGESHGQ